MIRPVKPKEDARDIAAIYNEYVQHSTVTFETVPLSLAEMQERIESIAAVLPYLVYEQEGHVAGFCYVHPWRERIAYRHTLETTVYVARQCRRQGIGKQLMQALIRECRHTDCHALVACITSENEASCALHRKLGFKEVSRFKEVGLKFGRWLDVSDYELLTSTDKE